MKQITFVVGILTMVSLAGCTVINNKSNDIAEYQYNRPAEQWLNDSRKLSEVDLSRQHINLIIYREKNILSSNRAINVYLNTKFVTSLREDKFKHVVSCPGKHNLQATFTLLDDAYEQKNQIGQVFTMSQSGVYYLKLMNDGEKIIFYRVDKDQAEEELADNLEQAHALSRTGYQDIECD